MYTFTENFYGMCRKLKELSPIPIMKVLHEYLSLPDLILQIKADQMNKTK